MKNPFMKKQGRKVESGWPQVKGQGKEQSLEPGESGSALKKLWSWTGGQRTGYVG
jgi:hypothetical protein